MRAVAGFAVAAALMALPRGASAHDTPFTYLDVHIRPGWIETSLVAHHIDVAHDLQIDPADALLDPRTTERFGEQISALLQRRVRLTADGRALPVIWTLPTVLARRESLELRARHPLPVRPATVAVDAWLFPYDLTHQTFVNIYEGDELSAQAVLDSERRAVEHFSGTRQGTVAVMRRFVPAGVHHILIGPDHLLFLVGLLLLGASLRQLALVVTAFTVAHSVTLSLAVLGVFRPPAQIVEPAIALSIVYVGADNLLVRNARDVRPYIALVFGLVHGFGFASVLSDMSLPLRAVGWSLFSFNFGVEVGQLVVVLPVAAGIGLLRARSAAGARRVAVVGSIAVASMGAFWFIERVFLAA